MLNRRLRISLGVLVVVALIGIPIWTISPKSSQSANEIVSFFVSWPEEMIATGDSELPVVVNEVVFGRDAEGEMYVVGMVKGIRGSSDDASRFTVQWNSQALSPAGSEFVAHQTPRSLEWVARLMLPPEKREKLSQSLMVRMSQYQDRLLVDIEPLLIDSAKEMLPILQARFADSIRRQQPEISEVVLRYQSELFEEKFLPLAKEEILPIVEREVSPLLQRVGSELFAKASVWRFTWRYLYDASPLPNQDLFSKEFNRFTKNDAIPILENYTDEIVATLARTSKAIAKNPKVRGLIRQSAKELFQDPELRSILADTFEDVFSDTEALTQIVRRQLESQRGVKFQNNLKAAIEPWFEQVGREIFGTRTDGLTPEFVSVLRTQILSKDREWIEMRVVERSSATENPLGTGPFTIRLADQLSPFPMVEMESQR